MGLEMIRNLFHGVEPLQATFTRVWPRQALMELGSSAALQAAERAQQLEPKDAKVLELCLGYVWNAEICQWGDGKMRLSMVSESFQADNLYDASNLERL